MRLCVSVHPLEPGKLRGLAMLKCTPTPGTDGPPLIAMMTLP